MLLLLCLVNMDISAASPGNGQFYIGKPRTYCYITKATTLFPDLLSDTTTLSPMSSMTSLPEISSSSTTPSPDTTTTIPSLYNEVHIHNHLPDMTFMQREAHLIIFVVLSIIIVILTGLLVVQAKNVKNLLPSVRMSRLGEDV